jgi:hypothetical protein
MKNQVSDFGSGYPLVGLWHLFVSLRNREIVIITLSTFSTTDIMFAILLCISQAIT